MIHTLEHPRRCTPPHLVRKRFLFFTTPSARCRPLSFPHDDATINTVSPLWIIPHRMRFAAFFVVRSIFELLCRFQPQLFRTLPTEALFAARRACVRQSSHRCALAKELHAVKLSLHSPSLHSHPKTRSVPTAGACFFPPQPPVPFCNAPQLFSTPTDPVSLSPSDFHGSPTTATVKTPLFRGQPRRRVFAPAALPKLLSDLHETPSAIPSLCRRASVL